MAQVVVGTPVVGILVVGSPVVGIPEVVVHCIHLDRPVGVAGIKHRQPSLPMYPDESEST